jgi:hypothetical protein
MTAELIPLKPLNEDHVSQLYERATAYESTFRNILTQLAGDSEGIDFIQTATLDELFDQYVNVSGNDVIRVIDFRIGPFANETESGSNTFQCGKTYETYRTDFSQLSKKNAVILFEDSEYLMLRGYKVLNDSSLKNTQFENRHQI